MESVFGQDKAVLVLDMSGFSRTTRRHGVVSFLLMIHQMKLIAMPAIEERGGLLVKAEADNLFRLFDTAADAVGAAGEIVRRLDTVNLLLPEGRRLYASVGVGYGRILNVGDEDLFGDEVNLASKLGEDVAERGVLLTPRSALRTAGRLRRQPGGDAEHLGAVADLPRRGGVSVEVLRRFARPGRVAPT